VVGHRDRDGGLPTAHGPGARAGGRGGGGDRRGGVHDLGSRWGRGRGVRSVEGSAREDQSREKYCASTCFSPPFSVKYSLMAASQRGEIAARAMASCAASASSASK